MWGVNCFMQASLIQFCLLFTDHFVWDVTEKLLFLIYWKREKIRKRVCSKQVSIAGLLAVTQLQCGMGCRGHHAILYDPNRFILRDNVFLLLMVPLTNFASMSNCPWVQAKSNKPPSPDVCV